MAQLDFTIRSLLVARLKREFGEPIHIAQVYRWTMDHVQFNQPPVITVNCWRTPDQVSVWMFDPREHDVQRAVRCFRVHAYSQIEPVVRTLRRALEDAAVEGRD